MNFKLKQEHSDAILEAAAFVRLLDENKQLSLTNVAVIIVLCKIAFEPSLDYTAVAALLGVISSYSFKRYIQRKHKKDSSIVSTKGNVELEKLRSDLNKVMLKQGLTPNDSYR